MGLAPVGAIATGCLEKAKRTWGHSTSAPGSRRDGTGRRDRTGVRKNSRGNTIERNDRNRCYLSASYDGTTYYVHTYYLANRVGTVLGTVRAPVTARLQAWWKIPKRVTHNNVTLPDHARNFSGVAQFIFVSRIRRLCGPPRAFKRQICITRVYL